MISGSGSYPCRLLLMFQPLSWSMPNPFQEGLKNLYQKTTLYLQVSHFKGKKKKV